MGKIPRMATIQWLSEETGVSYYAIRKLCLERKIVFIRSGKKYLVNVEKFMAYLNGEGVNDEKEKIAPVQHSVEDTVYSRNGGIINNAVQQRL